MTRRNVGFLLAGLVVTVLLAGVGSYYASASPDGLEKVAGDTGFGDTAKDHSLAQSPFAHYGTSGVDDARLSGGLAGVVGVVVTVGVAGGLFFLVRRRGGSGAAGTTPDDVGSAGLGDEPVSRAAPRD